MEKRHSRSLGRRSSILKVDRDDDTCTTGIIFKTRKPRRVSFAETYQVKRATVPFWNSCYLLRMPRPRKSGIREFPKDSPSVWQRNNDTDDEESTGNNHETGAGNSATITGLDKLLTGAIQNCAYKNIIECPIPEMSSDSLNTSKLFDINRTVLGHVDMDTTDVEENDDIDLPFLDTGQDCSREIKFDASSFLKNLQSKPQDSSKLMKDRSPLKSLSIPQETGDNLDFEKQFKLFEDSKCPDKQFRLVDDNVYPKKPFSFNLSYDNDTNLEPKIDAKLFLTNIIGSKQKNTAKKSSEEITPGQNDHSFEDSMDETICYGGIVGKDAVKELTSQISEKVNNEADQTTERQPFEDIHVSADKENDIRPVYNRDQSELMVNQTLAMEETQCHGGIFNKSSLMKTSKELSANKNENMSPLNQTMAMEETKCVEGILNRTLTKEIGHKRLSDEQTKVFLSHEMDETKCHGGILNKTNFTTELEKLQLSAAQYDIDMEETKCLTSVINKTVKNEPASGDDNKENSSFHLDKLVPSDETNIYQAGQDLEETKCLTVIINRDTTSQINVSKKVEGQSVLEKQGSPVSKTAVKENIPAAADLNDKTILYKSFAVDETKCYDSAVNVPTNTSDKSDKTLSDMKSLLMEETKCVGGIMNKTMTKELNLKQLSDSTILYQNVNMDETKGQEGINKTTNTAEIKVTDKTVEMEETKCLGGFMNKTITKELKSISNITKLYENFDMEETKSHGGILNKTNAASEIDTSVEMRGEKYLKNDLSQKNDFEDKNDLDSGEITFNFKSGISRLKENQEAIKDKTVLNQTVAMEITNCVELFDRSTKDLCSNGDTGQLKSSNKYSPNSLLSLAVPSEITLNHTVMMEETKCMEGLKSNENREILAKTNYDKTLNQTSAMEITNCVDTKENADADIDKSIVIGNEDNIKSYENMEVSDAVEIIQKENKPDIKLEKDSINHKTLGGEFSVISNADMNRNENIRNMEGKENIADTSVDSDIDRMNEDSSSKITEENWQSSQEADPIVPNEITRETTQSQTRLQKLKDKLILCKTKTPTHFKRPVEPKTDKNLDYCLNDGSRISHEEIRSPAHKKKKLFDCPSEVSKAGDRTLTADIGILDIDDEQMPDLMKMDNLLSESHLSVSTVTLSSCGNDTLKLAPSSSLSTSGTCSHNTGDDKLIFKPETIFSSTETLTRSSSNTSCSFEQTKNVKKRRFTSGNSSSDNTGSSGNKDFSICQKSFLSLTADSFMIPQGGPVTLETFKKVMRVKPPILVKSSGRRSSFMLPRVDTEDMGELLLAELTLNPEVKATVAAYDDIKERTKSNEELSLQLQADLEETQPQIFQDCVELEGPELQSLQCMVMELNNNCRKLSRCHWLQRTTKAVSETLEMVQDEGLSTVESIQEEIRSDKQQTELMIKSVDDDLEDFMKITQLLEELEQKKNRLENELETVLENVEKQEEIKQDLSNLIDKQNEENNSLTALENIKLAIRGQLFCQEWDLCSLEGSSAIFTFLDNELELTLSFSKNENKLSIQNVYIQSLLNPGSTKVSKRLAHSMALAGIDTERLKQKYCSTDNISQLLYEVSEVISEIREFCADYYKLYLAHDIKVDRRRISCDLWSLETLDEITVNLDFNPSCPLSSPARIDVTVIMGTIRAEKIVEDLQAVKPGKKYLSRLISAVKFK